MIVVDASAIVAINLGEDGFEAYEAALLAADRVVASPINLVEAGMVIASRLNTPDSAAYGQWLAAWRIEPDDAVDWGEALTALMAFG
ncbi:MAG TPA: type II toxin-antitoxin system VapC family toxin, partial [Caulobacter sp.]|nr:type II toxin-antitoxin system VapC family toxin [Caulobacter sp.]